MTRSSRYRFQDEIPSKPADDERTEKMRKLIRMVLMMVAIVVLGTLSVMWINSDYSGEYHAQDRNLGHITMELIRHTTRVSGTISIGSNVYLEVVDGHVDNNNQVELSFAPKGQDEDNRFIAASFKGMIDPPSSNQGSVTISFSQVLDPYGEEKGNSGVTVPRMSSQEKLINGVLTYNAHNYEISFRRNSLTSLFRQLKSYWPGAS